MQQLNSLPSRLFKQVSRVVSLVLFTLVYLIISVPSSAFAATSSATMSLSPATGIIDKGSSIQLTIQVAAGSNQITGAQACIIYSSTKLTLTNTNTSASGLGTATPGGTENCPAGEAQVSQFDLQPGPPAVVKPATGTFTLAVLTFRAEQSGMSVPVAFDVSHSYIYDNATSTSDGSPKNILTGATDASITFSTAPASGTPTTTITTTDKSGANITTKVPTPANLPAFTSNPSSLQSISSDVTAQSISTVNKALPAATHAKSRLTTLLIIGAVILALVLTGSLAKIVKSKMPNFPKDQSTDSIAVTQLSEDDPDRLTHALEHVPDPKVPKPSSVVQPTISSEDDPLGKSPRS